MSQGVRRNSKHRWCIVTYADDGFGTEHVASSVDAHDAIEAMIAAEAARRFDAVLAIGSTPGDAILSLAEDLGWGRVDEDSMRNLKVDSARFEWSISFAASGTSFKAAGRFVPGGATLTWWK